MPQFFAQFFVGGALPFRKNVLFVRLLFFAALSGWHANTLARQLRVCY
jgi:hypothetical protein